MGVKNPGFRSIAALAIVMAIYYAAPIGASPSTTRLVVGIAGMLIGIAVLGWLIVAAIRRQLRADPATARIESLLILLYLVVAVFASGYLTLARSMEGSFVGMHTKTDALYFTVSTVATVGFGDVHASGQLARLLVTIQIVFDLVFVAALVAALSGGVRRRVAARRDGEAR